MDQGGENFLVQLAMWTTLAPQTRRSACLYLWKTGKLKTSNTRRGWWQELETASHYICTPKHVRSACYCLPVRSRVSVIHVQGGLPTSINPIGHPSTPRQNILPKWYSLVSSCRLKPPVTKTCPLHRNQIRRG